MGGRNGTFRARLVTLLLFLLSTALLTPPAALAASAVSCNPGSGTSTISGTVTVDGGGDAGSILVTAYTAYGERAAYTYVSGGSYQLTGLIPGQYLLQVEPSLGGYATRWYPNAPTWRTATAVTVSGAATVDPVNLTIGARFSGQLKGPSDEFIANARVTVYDSSGQQLETVFTDSFGMYATRHGLPAGSYRLRFEGTGPFIDEYYADAATLAQATPLAVTATQLRTVNAVLARGGTISGKVVMAGTNTPLSGIEVTASGDNDSGYDYTAADGTYTIEGLASGAYTVSAGPLSDSQNLVEVSQEAAVTAPDATANVNFALAPGGTLTGNVTNSAGEPLAGITVYISNEAGSYQRYVSTNAGGTYTASAMPSGHYSVFFRPSQHIPELYDDQPDYGEADRIAVTAPGTVTGIDAVLVTGASITGKVTEADGTTPIEGVYVEVLDGRGGRVEGAFTGADGTYAIYPVLPTGSYKVRFNAGENNSSCAFVTEYYSAKTSFAAADSVSVTAPNVTPNINAAMSRGSMVFGRVTDEATGDPITSGVVRFFDASGESEIYGRLTFNGGYRAARALPSGTYRVLFSDYDGGHVDEYYNNKLTLAQATPLVLTAPNDVLGIDGALAGGGLIGGRATVSSDGAPFAAGSVIVLDTQGNAVGYASIESDGTYVVRDGLATGSYLVAVVPDADGEMQIESLKGLPPGAVSRGYITTFYGGAVTPGTATPVQVTAGNTTANVDIGVRFGRQLPLVRR